MTGAELFAYLQRRLTIEGLADEALDAPELYDYLSEGRDELLATFSLAAPVVVKSLVTLVVDGVDDRIYTIPAATKDPYRILLVRDVTNGDPLVPTVEGNLNQDASDYEWIGPRTLRLSRNAAPPGGVECYLIPHAAPITAATTEAQVGLPTPCHRAIGKFAAVLALTGNEESDASTAVGLFERELARLERIYAEYDMSGGMGLRDAMLATYGQLMGDSIY